MTWTIDDREAEALRRFLDEYLPEFEYGLSRVKLPRDRHELVAQDELLHALRDRLGGEAKPLGVSRPPR